MPQAESTDLQVLETVVGDSLAIQLLVDALIPRSSGGVGPVGAAVEGLWGVEVGSGGSPALTLRILICFLFTVHSPISKSPVMKQRRLEEVGFWDWT